MMRCLVCVLSILVACDVLASPLDQSLQVMVVTVASPDDFHGHVQRYQRVDSLHAWRAVGSKFPVVLGKKGVALHKKEGDLRTPAGIFSLGTAFGLSPHMKRSLTWPYRILRPSTVCVDDPSSSLYNQWVENAHMPGEKMFSIRPFYDLGIVIDYNTKRPVRGAGSCVFMHVWHSNNIGTSGCVAMSLTHLHALLGWLDQKKNPRIVIWPLTKGSPT